MSVTTSAVFNQDQFDALLPQGTTYGWTGPPFDAAGEKVVTATCTDADLQAAVTGAAGSFVDRKANADSLLAKSVTALTTNATYLGHASIPAGTLTLAQLSTIVRLLSDQVDMLTRENTALIRLAANLLDSTSGT